MTDVDPEVLLHPVRIKILTALAVKDATPHDIAATLGDIPKASLYRHINILRAMGAIREVREYRVRGTFEKVYALVTDSGPLAGLGPAPAGQISEFLWRMIQPVPSPSPAIESSWRQSALLSSAALTELQALIEDFLNVRNDSAGQIVEIALTIYVDAERKDKK